MNVARAPSAVSLTESSWLVTGAMSNRRTATACSCCGESVPGHSRNSALSRSRQAVNERTAMAVTSSRPRSLAGSIGPAAVTG